MPRGSLVVTLSWPSVCHSTTTSGCTQRERAHVKPGDDQFQMVATTDSEAPHTGKCSYRGNWDTPTGAHLPPVLPTHVLSQMRATPHPSVREGDEGKGKNPNFHQRPAWTKQLNRCPTLDGATFANLRKADGARASMSGHSCGKTFRYPRIDHVEHRKTRCSVDATEHTDPRVSRGAKYT